MDLLDCAVQSYDWGSPTAIPDIVGANRTGEPWAELWMGAHPSAPARIRRHERTVGLDEVIVEDPASELGRAVTGVFGKELPFLFKILAAKSPLSLQAHPNAAQAAEGFAAEEEAGVARDARERVFRDERHKPELICALDRFDALCGFRPIAQTITLLRAFDAPLLDGIADELSIGGADALAPIVERLLGAAEVEARTWVAAVATGAPNLRGPHTDVGVWARRLASRYRSDAGVVVAMLLNHVQLEPGEALFLGAGNLHAYLSGTAVELMANSDNVVRGGLTTKHVDVAQLLDVVTWEPERVEVQRPVGSVHTYDAPVSEFALTRLRLDGTELVAVEGPAILVVLDGPLALAGDNDRVELRPGQSAFIRAADGLVRVEGHGLAFLATVGAL